MSAKKRRKKKGRRQPIYPLTTARPTRRQVGNQRV